MEIITNALKNTVEIWFITSDGLMREAISKNTHPLRGNVFSVRVLGHTTASAGGDKLTRSAAGAVIGFLVAGPAGTLIGARAGAVSTKSSRSESYNIVLTLKTGQSFSANVNHSELSELQCFLDEQKASDEVAKAGVEATIDRTLADRSGQTVDCWREERGVDGKPYDADLWRYKTVSWGLCVEIAEKYGVPARQVVAQAARLGLPYKANERVKEYPALSSRTLFELNERRNRLGIQPERYDELIWKHKVLDFSATFKIARACDARRREVQERASLLGVPFEDESLDQEESLDQSAIASPVAFNSGKLSNQYKMSAAARAEVELDKLEEQSVELRREIDKLEFMLREGIIGLPTYEEQLALLESSIK